jgi:hypothetical protein
MQASIPILRQFIAVSPTWGLAFLQRVFAETQAPYAGRRRISNLGIMGRNALISKLRKSRSEASCAKRLTSTTFKSLHPPRVRAV